MPSTSGARRLLAAAAVARIDGTHDALDETTDGAADALADPRLTLTLLRLHHVEDGDGGEHHHRDHDCCACVHVRASVGLEGNEGARQQLRSGVATERRGDGGRALRLLAALLLGLLARDVGRCRRRLLLHEHGDATIEVAEYGAQRVARALFLELAFRLPVHLRRAEVAVAARDAAA